MKHGLIALVLILMVGAVVSQQFRPPEPVSHPNAVVKVTPSPAVTPTPREPRLAYSLDRFGLMVTLHNDGPESVFYKGYSGRGKPPRPVGVRLHRTDAPTPKPPKKPAASSPARIKRAGASGKRPRMRCGNSGPELVEVELKPGESVTTSVRWKRRGDQNRNMGLNRAHLRVRVGQEERLLESAEFRLPPGPGRQKG